MRISDWSSDVCSSDLLVDVRRPPAHLPTATGRKRSGKRLLTVGTDCALGKKYTALALTRALRASGANADFRASGQTGILIAGSGIAMDRSEEHTSELQSLMRISYAVFCLKKKTTHTNQKTSRV